MIDLNLADLIRQVLTISTADMNEARELLLEEQRSADASYATSNALLHPEGSTTPINEAYSRAQDRVANIRSKAVKALPAAFSLLVALKVAEERRDEAQKHRDMKWDQAFAKDTLGVDPAVADWYARLHKHGVHPHYLKQQAIETVAIVADLVSWKAKDPKFRDPDNPWRAVLQVYASRRIKKPLTKRSKAERSVPGIPTRDPHISDLGDYMFNEMVSAAWSTEVSERVVEPPVKATASVTFDCSIYPDERPVLAAVDGAEENEAVKDAQDDLGGRSAWQRATEQFDANPNAMSDLQYEIILCGRDPSWPDIVRRLTTCAGPSPQGDFSVFIAAVEEYGDIGEGWAAYRQEAIGRIARRLEG